MIEYSVTDLEYATFPVLLTVQAVYDRYAGATNVSVPGITHLADINADTRRVAALATKGDEKTKILLAATFAGGNLFGAIDRDDTKGVGIIAFRGTKSFKEWIDDALFDPVKFDEVRSAPLVHAGFRLVYTTVRKSLMDQIHLLDGLNRIIVTGHSLGAAVASLCLLDLAANGDVAKYDGCTFASPRVFWGGTRAFEETILKNLRVANPADIVTHAPSNFAAYFHVKGGLQIHSKIKDFHSLLDTYLPGVQKLIEGATGPTVPLQDAEHVLLQEALRR
jgi:hypothetical protein